MIHLRGRQDTDNVLMVLKQKPELKDAIEKHFQNSKNWIETDSNFWQSKELTKKAFYMYCGIDFQKTSLLEIAKELNITKELVIQKVERVIMFLRDEIKK